jgi:NAD(P)H-hydrate epimerase
VAVVCGGGNNGGDGLVTARTLVNHGAEVITVLIGTSPALLKGECAENFRALASLQPEIHVVEGMDHIDPVFSRLESCLILVDALFGIGLNRALEGVHLRAVQQINAIDKPTVSVDIPSGLDADTGAVYGTAVLADLTMTFGAAKRGMTRGHGPDHCGRIEVAEIGFPGVLIEKALMGQI